LNQPKYLNGEGYIKRDYILMLNTLFFFSKYKIHYYYYFFFLLYSTYTVFNAIQPEVTN